MLYLHEILDDRSSWIEMIRDQEPEWSDDALAGLDLVFEPVPLSYVADRGWARLTLGPDSEIYRLHSEEPGFRDVVIAIDGDRVVMNAIWTGGPRHGFWDNHAEVVDRLAARHALYAFLGRPVTHAETLAA